MKQKKKIIGFYGATGSYDFDDYAMMVHNIEMLFSINPKIRFIVFTPSEQITLECLNSNIKDKNLLNRIELINDKLIPDILNKKIYYYADSLIKKLFDRNYSGSMKLWNETNYGQFNMINSKVLSGLREIDILLFNGGGYIQNSWGSQNIRFMTYINIAHFLNKKVYFLGNSFGPLNSIYAPYVSNSLRYVERIFVRDGKRYSYQFLENIIPHNKIIFSTDDLMFVSKEYEIKPILDNQYIVVEIMAWIDKAKEGRNRVLSELIIFLNYILSQNYKVVLINFDKDDLIAKQCFQTILKRVTNQKLLYIIEEIASIQQVITIYKYAEFSVSMKYHPIILSIGNAVPCIGIICDKDGYYEGKMYGAFESAGLDGCKNILYLDQVTGERLIKLFQNRNLELNEPKMKELLQIRRDYIYNLAAD